MNQRLISAAVALVIVASAQTQSYAVSASVTVTSSNGNGNNTVYFKYTGAANEIIDVQWQEATVQYIPGVGMGYVGSGNVFAQSMTQRNTAWGSYMYHDCTINGGLPPNKFYFWRIMRKKPDGTWEQVYPDGNWGFMSTGS